MAYCVVAFPLKFESILPKGRLITSRDFLDETSEKEGAQFGIFTDPRFDSVQKLDINNASVKWPKQSNIELMKAEVFSTPEFKVAVCYFEVLAEGEEALKTVEGIRRLRTDPVQQALKGLGLEVDICEQVRATSVIQTGDSLHLPTSDALLIVSPGYSRFVFFQTWGILAALVCVERLLLDQATSFISLGKRSHQQSARHLRGVLQWRSVLSSDRTELHIQFKELRESLRLNERYSQTLEILREDARLAERRNNAVTVLSGISLTAVASFIDGKFPFDMALVLVVPLAVGLLSFFFVGRIKR
jgi:hypothetical protein